MKYVSDKHANEQINEIAMHVHGGLSDAQISNIFNGKKKNLKTKNMYWNENDIKEIRESFKLTKNKKKEYSVKYSENEDENKVVALIAGFVKKGFSHSRIASALQGKTLNINSDGTNWNKKDVRLVVNKFNLNDLKKDRIPKQKISLANMNINWPVTLFGVFLVILWGYLFNAGIIDIARDGAALKRNTESKKTQIKFDAINACESYAKSNARHPSSVDFSKFTDLSIIPHENGRVTIYSSFTARNSFNMEAKYNIKCLVSGGVVVMEGEIYE